MTKKTFVKELEPYVELHFDEKSGIAWVENGNTGMGHSAHPNIHGTGSVSGMKKQGYWKPDAETKRCRGFIHNIDVCLVSDDYDEIARQHCRCGGNHKRST